MRSNHHGSRLPIGNQDGKEGRGDILHTLLLRRRGSKRGGGIVDMRRRASREEAEG